MTWMIRAGIPTRQVSPGARRGEARRGGARRGKALWVEAGLYLGTVVVRTVPGARWHVWPGGRVVVRLPSGRELHVVEAGVEWAVHGAPELSQMYAEISEG